MKRIIILCVMILWGSPILAQTDSTNISQSPIIVSLDSEIEERLASIDSSAKPYSLHELFRFPKGLDSVNLGFWLAVLALWFSIRTYFAQKKTERHTTNAPLVVQQWKLKDLPRHFYRNLVCTSALILKFRNEGVEKKRNRYPSESNLKKLQTLPDDIVLPIDVDTNKDAEQNAYKHMHELRLLLRNYNFEVEVASDHLSRRTISDESLKQDFDNLLFKPIHLTYSTFKFEKSLSKKGEEKKLVERTIYSILTEHFKKLSIATNFNLLFSSTSSQYLEKLFGDTEAFIKLVDDKEGLDRSINNLLEYGYRNERVDDKEYGLSIKKSGEKHKASLARKVAIPILSNSLDSTGYVAGITDIHKEEDFVNFYSQFYNDAKQPTPEQLKTIKEGYVPLRPYFDYIAQENWDISSLIKVIITIDAVIEIDRIGMVNYK